MSKSRGGGGGGVCYAQRTKGKACERDGKKTTEAFYIIMKWMWSHYLHFLSVIDLLLYIRRYLRHKKNNKMVSKKRWLKCVRTYTDEGAEEKDNGMYIRKYKYTHPHMPQKISIIFHERIDKPILSSCSCVCPVSSYLLLYSYCFSSSFSLVSLQWANTLLQFYFWRERGSATSDQITLLCTVPIAL